MAFEGFTVPSFITLNFFFSKMCVNQISLLISKGTTSDRRKPVEWFTASVPGSSSLWLLVWKEKEISTASPFHLFCSWLLFIHTFVWMCFLFLVIVGSATVCLLHRLAVLLFFLRMWLRSFINRGFKVMKHYQTLCKQRIAWLGATDTSCAFL